MTDVDDQSETISNTLIHVLAVKHRTEASSSCLSGCVARKMVLRNNTLGRESQCICGNKVKTAWDAAHSGSQTSQCNQV